ncbi:conjugal transfer protein TraN [Hydrogenovibrio marinus]|uniref:Conjugal transfer protein TraN n=1 Tax=Hydrogenovibrio marinus TaxID=28885 RepID=A0A066ZML3_HYDMR|nr:conjugal transfer protein TraN [Hydrogenovibrio marinus]KDN94717.1 hypothetical protein EI16_12535 [Hydrogenovibrio marinus]
MNNRFRKKFAVFSLFLWSFNALAPAYADVFQDAQNLGYSKNSKPGSGSLSNVPGYDPNTNYNSTGDQYFTNGKTGVDSLTKIYDAGTATKTQAQAGCTPGDKNCQAIKYLGDRNGAYQSNPYTGTAKTMAAGVSSDPESVLGMGVPGQNAGNVCVESTTQLPSTTESKTCLESQFKSMNIFSKIPTTTGTNYTSPVCLDPSYTISGDLSTCSKQVYSCPDGGTLNGTTCTQTTDKITVYSGAVDCSQVPSVGYSRNSQDHVNISLSCQSGQMRVTSDAYGDWGGLFRNGVAYHPIGATLNNYPLSPLAPSWGGDWRNVGTFVSGGCSNGICTYTYMAGWSNYAWLKDAAAQSPGTVCPTYSRGRCWSGYFSPNPNPVNGATYSTPIMDCNKFGCHPVGSNTTYYPPMNNAGTIYSQTVNFADPRQPSLACPSGYADQSGTCTKTYPATLTTTTTTPGCLGGAVYSAGQLVQDPPVYTSGTQSGGSYTCASTTYSCPAGMYQNGYMCQDDSSATFTTNPACVNLGYDTSTQTEAYYCSEKKLDECTNIDPACTLTASNCVYKDTVPGSPTEGQCLATEKTYSCPVPGKTITTQSCNYQPMCYNGNCYNPPGTNCTGKVVTQNKTVTKTCYGQRAQQIHQCSLVVTKDPATGQVTSVAPGADCDQWKNDASCMQIIPKPDANGNYSDLTAYSCLSTETNDCSSIQSDTSCQSTPNKSCVKYENLDQVSNPTNGRCITEKIDYSCTDTFQAPGDECTTDLSKTLVSLEAGREAGNYLDPTTMKMFKGEQDRCDRRSAGFWGSGLGSKSCCNIDAPDPQTNNDVMTSQIGNLVKQFVDYGVQKGSAYMYDFMMNSQAYADSVMNLWQAGVISDETAINSLQGAGTASTWDNVNFTPTISYAGIGITYAGTGAATASAGAVVNGGATATSTFGLGGGFQLSFSPVGFYLYAAIALYSAYQQQLACDEEDYRTATKSKGGLCYATHSFCADEDCGIFGCICRKYRTSKCCYNSKLAKIINQQGKAQLGITGSADDCSGFTTAQLNNLDWSKIDMTEFVSDMLKQAQNGVPSASDIQAVTNNIKGQVGTSGVTRAHNYTP